MSDPTTVYAALTKAQTAMRPALKNAENPHFRSRYADLASVQDACMEALHANGFAVLQPLIEDDGDLSIATQLVHESGHILECRVPLFMQRIDMQGLGSAITYARRYGLMCMTGVAPEDDDGEAAGRSKKPAPDMRTTRQEFSDRLANAPDLDALRDEFIRVKAEWAAMTSGPFPADLVAIKDRRKAELSPAASPLAGEAPPESETKGESTQQDSDGDLPDELETVLDRITADLADASTSDGIDEIMAMFGDQILAIRSASSDAYKDLDKAIRAARDRVSGAD